MCINYAQIATQVCIIQHKRKMIILGDCKDVIKEYKDNSVQHIITSPPIILVKEDVMVYPNMNNLMMQKHNQNIMNIFANV